MNSQGLPLKYLLQLKNRISYLYSLNKPLFMSVPTLFTVPRNLLFSLGLPSAENTFYQLKPDELKKQCLERNEGILNETGDRLIDAGKFSDESSKDQLIVRDEVTQSSINRNEWDQWIEEKNFNIVYQKIVAHLSGKDIWIRDGYTSADPDRRLNIRIINETPPGNLFAYNMLLPPTEEELKNFIPVWYVIHVPTFIADPGTDGASDRNFTMISFTKKTILIGGTADPGEIRKAVCTVLNFLF